MAVKVMMAPAIASGDLSKRVGRKAAAKAGARPRQKRRRSSVYDADGAEVFITLVCLKCQQIRPLSQFGLRRMADGCIRNQPWCRLCRSSPSARSGKGEGREGSERSGDSPVSVDSRAPAPSLTAPAEAPRARSVAAEVAAALAGGRG